MIVTEIGGNGTHRSYRKLDGTTVEWENQELLYSTWLAAQPSKPGLVPYPISWMTRLGNTSDLGNPPVYWHFVRNKEMPGRAYFVGYGSVSKRQVSFIGRKGFRPALPPEEEWFDVSEHLVNGNPPIFLSTVGMSQARYYNNWRNRSSSTAQHPPDWVGYLVDGDRTLEIDFREQTVNVFKETPGATSLGFCAEPVLSEKSSKEPETTPDEVPSIKRLSRFLVRYPDRIDAWDLKGQTSETFLLPASLHHGGFSFYMLGKGKALVSHGHGYWERGPRYRLLWLDAAGNELREEVVNLVGYKPPPEHVQARHEAWTAPLPGYWIYRTFARRPFELLQHRQSHSYSDALLWTWNNSWRSIVVLVALAIVASMIAWRWHQKYARTNRMEWLVFVLLFSLPGLLVYWLMHRGTVLETCHECGQAAPRDRDACAHCEKPFAEPALLGTEIFV
ncbi:MAG: hypothetical protein MI725_08730 [Pirellulales bacterium]|nr:hypothetical protein [Pirellulales bacterium]